MLKLKKYDKELEGIKEMLFDEKIDCSSIKEYCEKTEIFKILSLKVPDFIKEITELKIKINNKSKVRKFNKELRLRCEIYNSYLLNDVVFEYDNKLGILLNTNPSITEYTNAYLEGNESSKNNKRVEGVKWLKSSNNPLLKRM